MKNILKAIKGTAVSALIILAGFLAMVIPFNLFDELSSRAMSIIFFGEIAVFIALGFAYLIHKELTQKRKYQEKISCERRRRKIEEKNEQWLNIAA